ncbi:MAG: DUF4198 domain-containing protein [Deltaproteobacteria bacterium]|nr:DUF4198 domain-containing protein [Deltaproteobacteria bacterium]
MKKIISSGLLIISATFVFMTQAWACHPWINVNNYKPKSNNTIRFHMAYGHNFPFGHSFYDNDKVEKLFMLTPEGNNENPSLRLLEKEKYSQIQYESKNSLMDGTYLIVMESKGNFIAKTDKGYQHKPKKELKGFDVKGNVKFSQNFCKAIVNVGGKNSGDSYGKVLGHGLEIVPLKDPGQLRTNDILPVRVLHNGEGIDESVMVYATYMGFSNETDVFAYTAWASSSKGGVAEIRVLEPGIWMLFVNHKFTYPDSETADEFSYQATLTFEVKP